MDWNDAALGAAKTAPHATALDEVFRAGIGGAERLVLDLAPVGHEAPFHRVQDERIVSAAEDWRLCPRCNIVPGDEFVLVLPASDVEVVSRKVPDLVSLWDCEHCAGNRVKD